MTFIPRIPCSGCKSGEVAPGRAHLACQGRGWNPLRDVTADDADSEIDALTEAADRYRSRAEAAETALAEALDQIDRLVAQLAAKEAS